MNIRHIWRRTTTASSSTAALHDPSGGEYASHPALADVLAALDALWRAHLPIETQQEFSQWALPATASFVSLGGDSLAATSLQEAISTTFGLPLARATLLSNDTLADLANRIVSAGAGSPAHEPAEGTQNAATRAHGSVGAVSGDGSWGQVETTSENIQPAPPIVRTPRSGQPLLASSGQQRFWVQHELEPQSTAANVSTVLQLRGPVDRGALYRALQALIDRHDILRTVLVPAAGDLAQRVLPELDLPLFTIEDWTDEDAPALQDNPHTSALYRAQAWIAQPFDLCSGPLFRADLLRLAPDEHFLMLSMHHAICDGWSMAVLYDELRQLYAAAVSQPSQSLPRTWWQSVLSPLRLQYADVAAWQRTQAKTPRVLQMLPYWQQALQDAPREIDLPTDFTRPAHPSSAGAHYCFALPAEAATRLRALCRAEGATPAAGMIAVFTAMLARYSRQDDLVVGLPLDGRDQAETRALPGFFVNTAAVRARFSKDLTFRAHLHQMHSALFGAETHGEVPFEQVVRALAPERTAANASSGALFNVMFAYQSAPPAPDLVGLEATPLQIESGAALFDLTLEVWARQETKPNSGAAASDGTFMGRIEYRTDLFRAQTIARMAQHLALLLERALERPDAPISSLTMLTSEEWAQMQRWNATQLPAGVVAEDQRACELIVEHATQYPNRLAIVANVNGPNGLARITITYGQFVAAAKHLAHHLLAVGAGPDETVALLLERSPAWAVAQLAVHLAGGGFILLDPDQPLERVARMIADAHPRALLTTRALAARLPFAVALEQNDADATTQIVLVDPWMGSDAPQTSLAVSAASSTQPAPSDVAHDREGMILISSHAPSNPVRPTRSTGEQTSYVVFTSGSTGVPKGVVTPHRGLENLIGWQKHAFGLGPWDRCTSLAGVGFDAVIWEAWPTWAAGACLYLVDDATRRDAVALRDFLLQEGITVAFVPTPMGERLLGLPWPVAGKTLPALRVLTIAGDRLHMYAPSGLPFTIWNAYGPSEGSVCSTAARVPMEGEIDLRALSTPSIGFPIGNVQGYVVDPFGQLTPIGVPGELCVGGRNVGLGYLNRPDLTAERFIRNPFFDGAANPSPVLYRTGDLVRWSTTGEGLEFLGRLDHQLKIRGVRIEAGEVESHLCMHPVIRAALVLGEPRVDEPTGQSHAPGTPGELQLVAYVECAPDQPRPTPVDVRQYLQGRVPAYMIPQRIVLLDSIPLTPNGKLDRQAVQRQLAQRQEAQPHVATFASAQTASLGHPQSTLAVLAPTPPVLTVVRALWQAALGHDDTLGSAEDSTDAVNFFDAGGDSLQATGLLAELRDVLNLNLDLHKFFTNRTLATVLGLLNAIETSPEAAQTVIELRAERILALWQATTSQSHGALTREEIGA